MKRNRYTLWLFSSLVFLTLVGCSGFRNPLFPPSEDTSSGDVENPPNQPLPPIDTPDSTIPGNSGETFTVFAINDLHGKIKKTAQYPGIVADEGAILANPNYNDESVILSTGDMWQGSYVSGFDKGLSTTQLMNDFPFAAMALGNHEFDWGFQTVLDNLKQAAFPFLSANLIDETTGRRPDGIQSHVTLNINGSFKLGVVGAIGASLESSIKASMIKGYSFSEDLNLLKEAIDECKREGATSVILLLHDDENSDYTNAIQKSSLDFKGIFGAHSHQLQKEEAPGIPYVQGSSDSRYYSYMTIDKGSGNLVDFNYVAVDDSLEVDATLDFKNKVDTLLESRPAPTLGQTVGTWTKEATMNFVVQAMFVMAKKNRPSKNYTPKSLVAAHNKAGIRGKFVSSDAPRDITMEDLQTISPFSNEVMLLQNRSVDNNQLQTKGNNSYNLTYPESSSWTAKRTMDIVTIDFLVSDRFREAFSPSDPVPAERIKKDGESYLIYDLLSDYVKTFSGTPIDASNYL